MGNAKTGLLSLFSNITTYPVSSRGRESVILKDLYNCTYIGNRNNRNKKEKDFVDVHEIDNINSFSELILQYTPPNFFGGKLSEYAEYMTKILATYTGTLYITVTDPLILPYNPAEKIYERFDSSITKNDIKAWDRLLDEAVYMFPGENIEQVLGFKPKKTNQYDFFVDLARKFYAPTEMDPVFDIKAYDVMYYGHNKNGYREKLIRKYFPRSTNNLLVAYKTKHVKA